MRVLLVSDIHGNLPALEFVLQLEQSADLVISIGDVVNYGPWSNECVDLLESLTNKVLLKGNHEEIFLAGNYPGENVVAQAFFQHCYPSFDRNEAIAAYQDEYFMHGYRFVHTINDEYIFPDMEPEIDQSVFIGHSHRLFSKKIGRYILTNVGSTGQNRTNLDEINYVIWNPETDEIELKRQSFDNSLLISEMKIRNYPEICLDYLLSKRINK